MQDSEERDNLPDVDPSATRYVSSSRKDRRTDAAIHRHVMSNIHAGDRRKVAKRTQREANAVVGTNGVSTKSLGEGIEVLQARGLRPLLCVVNKCCERRASMILCENIVITGCGEAMDNPWYQRSMTVMTDDVLSSGEWILYGVKVGTPGRRGY